ncbi:cell wall-active antibiotics response protein LiaF [Jeotgalibacillus proteolyticus]|uniref:cell wall-active antibiotics response protein LiaF n=1 Tax=Jeotgalibacillus proteolyticus TaxID=2082395 RepID=UPI003CFB111E
MFSKFKTDMIANWVLLALGLVLIEILFFSSGTLFSLFFAGVLLYLGRKKFTRLLGKIIFGLGLLTLVLTILSMFTLKLLVLAGIVYWVSHYFKTQKDPEIITPKVNSPQESGMAEGLQFKREQLLNNKWVGHQHTPEHTYEWEDIQLQNGIGDVVIDLSNTVLPAGESVISIRSCVGKLTILVPYELDVAIRHSSLIGTASVFQFQTTRLWNESVSFTSESYPSSPQKIKILTSAWMGDLEVKRV